MTSAVSESKILSENASNTDWLVNGWLVRLRPRALPHSVRSSCGDIRMPLLAVPDSSSQARRWLRLVRGEGNLRHPQQRGTLMATQLSLCASGALRHVRINDLSALRLRGKHGLGATEETNDAVQQRPGRGHGRRPGSPNSSSKACKDAGGRSRCG